MNFIVDDTVSSRNVDCETRLVIVVFHESCLAYCSTALVAKIRIRAQVCPALVAVERLVATERAKGLGPGTASTSSPFLSLGWWLWLRLRALAQPEGCAAYRNQGYKGDEENPDR
jgi:hypothetical protein